MMRGREILAAAIGSIMLIGGGVYLYYYRAASQPAQQASELGANTLVIPTVDDMCKSRGAGEGEALKQCQADENAAGEFVIAWMGYNSFLSNGAISLDQIQLMGSLDDATPAGDLGADPSLGLDIGGDPSSAISSGIDPIPGSSSNFLQSPAQVALYCLQMSGDWITMQDCISTNDTSSTLSGIQ